MLQNQQKLIDFNANKQSIKLSQQNTIQNQQLHSNNKFQDKKLTKVKKYCRILKYQHFKLKKFSNISKTILKLWLKIVKQSIIFPLKGINDGQYKNYFKKSLEELNLGFNLNECIDLQHIGLKQVSILFSNKNQNVSNRYKYYNRFIMYKELEENIVEYIFNNDMGFKIKNKLTHLCCFLNYQCRLFNPNLTERLQIMLEKEYKPSRERKTRKIAFD